MNTKKLLKASLLVLLCSIGILAPIRHDEALALSCNGVLGPGGDLVLNSDVGPYPEKFPSVPAVTIVGPVDVDLQGHTVYCVRGSTSLTPSEGIHIQGTQAHVYNGIVRGCDINIVVEGDAKGTETPNGSHHVSNMESWTGVVGVEIKSENNHFDHILSTNDYIGFDARASHNHFDRNHWTGDHYGFSDQAVQR
jgi:hypothetical protein